MPALGLVPVPVAVLADASAERDRSEPSLALEAVEAGGLPLGAPPFLACDCPWMKARVSVCVQNRSCLLDAFTWEGIQDSPCFLRRAFFT